MNTTPPKFACPHCGQPLEIETPFPDETIDCPTCGKSIDISTANGRATSPGPQNPVPPPLPPEQDDLDAANSLLERLIGNVVHAILGIFRRVYQVLRWMIVQIWHFLHWIVRNFYSLLCFLISVRFLKFLLLLFVLFVLLVCLGGIVIGPYVLIVWLRRFPESTWPDWLLSPCDDAFGLAFPVEIVWLVLFALWGIVTGIKSYKRGALARWRERRARKEARRAAKEAARFAKQ